MWDLWDLWDIWDLHGFGADRPLSLSVTGVIGRCSEEVFIWTDNTTVR